MAILDGNHFKIHLFNVNLPQTRAKLSLKGEGMLAGEKRAWKQQLWHGKACNGP